MNSVKFQGIKLISRNSLAAEWSGPCTSTAVGVGVGLIPGGELRFQESHSAAKKKKKKQTLLCFYKLTMNYQEEKLRK